ncbi:hypothetical protein SZ39_4631 [Bacillus mycoides]|nr:hypothetical protein SZ39_4631 [Bacillus mycoides]
MKKKARCSKITNTCRKIKERYTRRYFKEIRINTEKITYKSTLFENRVLFSINDPYPAKGVYWGYTRETGKEFILIYINSEVGSSFPPLNY